MRRAEVLDTAKGYVTRDRQNDHGSPENTFGRIAQLWGVYLGTALTSADVAQLMILLKVARAQQNPKHDDNWVDIAGYAACASELSEVDDLISKINRTPIHDHGYDVEISDVE